MATTPDAPDPARLAAIRATLAALRYKPGWHLEAGAKGATLYLQVRYDGSGAYGAEPWTGRKWLLSEHMTTTEVVNTALTAVLAAEEHETRELLTYRGVAVFDPHESVEARVALKARGQLPPDVRADAMQGAA